MEGGKYIMTFEAKGKRGRLFWTHCSPVFHNIVFVDCVISKYEIKNYGGKGEIMTFDIRVGQGVKKITIL